MNSARAATLSMLLVLSVANPAAAGLADGEITLLGATARGDYGTSIESDSQWFTMRYITGDDLQFRMDVSMVRFQGFSSVGVTELGAVAIGENRWQGSHEHGASGSGTGTDAGQSATTPPVLTESRTTGLADVYVGASKRLIGGGVRLFRLDSNLEVKIPTADESKYLGTGEWDFRIGFAGEYRFWSATAYGGFGWNKLGDPPWLEFNDILDVFVGVDSDPFARERLIFSGWLEGWQEAVDFTGHRAAVGIGLQTTGRVRWRLQLRTGLTDATADLGVLFGVSFGVSPPGPGVRGPQL